MGETSLEDTQQVCWRTMRTSGELEVTATEMALALWFLFRSHKSFRFSEMVLSWCMRKKKERKGLELLCTDKMKPGRQETKNTGRCGHYLTQTVLNIWEIKKWINFSCLLKGFAFKYRSYFFKMVYKFHNHFKLSNFWNCYMVLIHAKKYLWNSIYIPGLLSK